MNTATEQLIVSDYEPLAQHTSWRIGGCARFYVEASSVDRLRQALHWGQERDLPIFLLGGGTNILVRDEGFDGLVIRYRAREWHITDMGAHALLAADAGTPIGRLAWVVGAKGWANLEWAAGLPGSVGGAIVGNAGCYGGDIASFLKTVSVLVDNRVEEWPAERMEFAYRTSILKKQQPAHLPEPNQGNDTGTHPVLPVVLKGNFELVQRDMGKLVETMKNIASTRKSKTPVGSSCGSVFKNPTSTTKTAGQLIDEAGLKGTRIGAAEISPMHANYIVNLGNAQSDDVVRLIDLARNRVVQHFGIELELEIQIIGGA